MPDSRTTSRHLSRSALRNAAKSCADDGALLLARDRPDGLIYDGSLVHPPTPALWG